MNKEKTEDKVVKMETVGQAFTNGDIMKALMDMKIASAKDMETLDKKTWQQNGHNREEDETIRKQVENKEVRDTIRINRMTERLTKIESTLEETLTKEEVIK